jgi:hypothetical protein
MSALKNVLLYRLILLYKFIVSGIKITGIDSG